MEATHDGQVVAIDLATGAYALDDTALAAARRVRTHSPDAAVWFVRVGHRALHRMGGHPIVGRL